MSDDSLTEPQGDPFASQLVRIDGDLEERSRVVAPTVNVPVRRPGQAETVRPPLPALAPRAAVRGQHNWVPIGPRNVGGRVRALAIDPNNLQIMYAGPASGGIFKTLDGGDSWFPLWHDEPSLSMAAIAVCAGTPATVWAATGEPSPLSAGANLIPTAGVLRSANSGAEWTQPNAAEAIVSTRINALAAHPTNVAVCWAAAEDGLYRTTDNGQTWHQFSAGQAFTDVAFLSVAAGPAGLRLFAVPRGPVVIGPPAANRGLVVRIDRPDDPDAALDALMPAVAGPFAPGADPLIAIGSPTIAVAGRGDPRDGKLAIFPGGQPGFANPVVFVVFGNTTGALHGVFRSTNAHLDAPNNRTFVLLPPNTVMNGETNSTYNLTIAVSPRNPNHIAFGMVELYLNGNAAANPPLDTHWRRAQMGDLYHIERGHHLDHHKLIFAPVPAAPFTNGAVAGNIALWDANDGGISWCANWDTGATFDIGTGTRRADAILPLVRRPVIGGAATPDAPLLWRKRSHGISCAQMYDLTQHPRLPMVIGCGFQDNGAFLSYGGPSWQLLLTADGGFVAFDPDDPYRVICTYQEGVTESRFPGRIRDVLPLLRDGVQMGFWPRELRDGFIDGDAARFIAETVLHPTQPGRLLTARRHRLYGTRASTGDRWIPEPVGTSFEILHRPVAATAGSSTIEVLDTAGARALGLLPQLNTARRAEGTQMVSRVRSLADEPFAIGAGLDVRLRFTNDAVPAVAPVAITVPLTVGPTLPASATAAQVTTYLNSEIRTQLAATPAPARPRVDAHQMVVAGAREVTIVSANGGSARQVVLSGTAATTFSIARAYHGADAASGAAALPAMAPLRFFRETNLTGDKLRVTREGGVNQIDFDFDVDLPAIGADPARASTNEIVTVLRSRLPAAHYSVWTGPARQAVRVSSTANTELVVDGNFATDLSIVPAAAPSRRLTGAANARGWQDSVNVSQTGTPLADRTLRVAEGGHQTAIQALNPAFLAVTDVTTVTMVELCDAIRRMITAVPAVRLRCDIDLTADDAHTSGEITEIAFGPEGRRIVWVGDSAGRLYRSTDDGESWARVPSPLDGRDALIEAIAVRPDRPDTVIVSGHVVGARTAPTQLLLRSDDGGATWPVLVTPIQDAAGGRHGARAIVFDPGKPDNVYAATDIGVFRSINGGTAWTPFDEGMPRVPVMDLTIEPATRMLRAGGWGRGVFERHVGDRAAKDVRLHIRSTQFDDGTSQPAPGPDTLAIRPEVLRFDASPDIKVFRREPRTGVLLDGVEFDDELRTTDVREGTAFIGVQVHNRGAFSTTGVRVLLMWAPADNGPPPVPVALWPALANPIAAGTVFGQWNVVDDEAITGVAGTGHDIVAPGYPRVNVFGAVLPFAWPVAVSNHRRIGLLAIARSADDPLGPNRATPIDVFDLVRTEAKAAYREYTVNPPAVDESIVLRATGASRFTIAAGAPAAQNGANGAAPFGLAVVAAPTAEVIFGTNGPYDLSGGPRRFRVQVQGAIIATLSADEPAIGNLRRVFANEVAAIVNRHLFDADLPVRANGRQFVQPDDSLFIGGVGGARFTVAGTGAAPLSVAAGALTNRVFTPRDPAAGRAPWDLSVGAARTLIINVTVDVEILLGAGVPEIPNLAAATGVDVRAAINRQLQQGGLGSIVAEPVRRSLAVRRSPNEAAGGGRRDTLGGLALADLVATAAAVAGEPARRALFDVIGTHGPDTIAGGADNHLYLRSSNTGNVAEAAVRHRLFLLDVTVSPVTSAALGAPFAQPIAAGASTVVEFVVPIPAVPAGERRFVVAIADVDADGRRLDLPTGAADAANLDAIHAFCITNPNAAIREFAAR